MKKQILIIACSVMLVAALWFVLRPKQELYDPFTELAIRFHDYLILDEYENYNELALREDILTESEFQDLRQLHMDAFGASIKGYQLLKFTDGQMLLLEVAKVHDDYKIIDIIKVPEEARPIFQEEEGQP